MKRLLFLLCVPIVATTLIAGAQQQGIGSKFDRPTFDLFEATILEIQDAFATHRINSKQLTKQYLDRIAAYEGVLNAVMTINPNAVNEAHQLDVERAHGDVRGPLHGIPIALKDNIHTTDIRTTGGA